MYEAGYSGIYYDPEAPERVAAKCQADYGFSTTDDAAYKYGWVNAGKGELVLPFIAVMELWPNAYPGDPQLEGSCVGHNGKNAGMVTAATEALCGIPDEVTKEVEGPPDVPPEGEKSGVFSPAVTYAYRGYRWHGWDCGSCAEVMTGEGGLVVAKNYDGLDLTNVTGRTENLTPSQIPAAVRQLAKKHRFRSSARCNSPEAIRDALAVGMGCQTCGGEGFSSSMNDWGVAAPRGSWPHAMAYGGWDERPKTIAKFGDRLVMLFQSWGHWNRGGRDIFDSAEYVPAAKRAEWISKGIVNAATGNIMIPKGAFWVKYSHVRRRSVYSMGGFSGHRRKRLENYGGSLAG
jgi:hypothetical protein